MARCYAPPPPVVALSPTHADLRGRHHRGRERPHPQRADHWRVLHQRPPRKRFCIRHQLRTGGGTDAPVSEAAGHPWRGVHQLLP